jgi:hypothetical protein
MSVDLSRKASQSSKITGCTITPNGKFIFADGGKKGLHILNEDWTSDNLNVGLPAIPNAYDVTPCDASQNNNDPLFCVIP